MPFWLDVNGPSKSTKPIARQKGNRGISQKVPPQDWGAPLFHRQNHHDRLSFFEKLNEFLKSDGFGIRQNICYDARNENREGLLLTFVLNGKPSGIPAVRGGVLKDLGSKDWI